MSEPKTPLLAVDGIVIWEGKLVLIERKNFPQGLALPGGFVEIGENIQTAVKREIKEETDLDFEPFGVVGIYSSPDRDPRTHVVTIVFAGKGKGMPKASSDAKEIVLVDPESIPYEKLVFDHAQVLRDWQEWMKTGKTFAR